MAKTRNESGIYLAKRYASQHGIRGYIGGWIGDSDPDSGYICQGWHNFWLLRMAQIKSWAMWQAGITTTRSEDGLYRSPTAVELEAALFNKQLKPLPERASPVARKRPSPAKRLNIDEILERAVEYLANDWQPRYCVARAMRSLGHDRRDLTSNQWRCLLGKVKDKANDEL